MKKLLLFLFIILIIIILLIPSKKEEEKEFRGIYISYIEISNYLNDKNENESKENIDKMINNIKKYHCNTIILHVRPSSDSIYNSKIFPISKYLSSSGTYSYDVLDYFIKKSHQNNIKLYAWINPYRISTTNNVDEINKNHPAYKYLNTDTIYISSGIYFNPSKKEVEDLIVNGVKEIIKYKVDGILFDDYFYPSDDIDINDYKKIDDNISLEEYHLKVVNHLIERVHDECKKNNIPFGISPDGNNDNNYHKNYADVKTWLSSDKYIDFIAPQLYYGFNNSTKPFINTLNEWNNLRKNHDIKFYPALAFYKVGKQDEYAKDGINEWINNNDIIMKQILYSRNINGYNGFILYRYDNIFNRDYYGSNSIEEINNVKKILK